MKSVGTECPAGSHGVTVSTQDSESCDPSSNLGGTFFMPMEYLWSGRAREARKWHGID